jgi:23S rRNA C2498 (ribose-2'-O)-methylase RlmM
MTDPATKLNLCRQYTQLCADLSEADARDDMKSIIQIQRKLASKHQRLCIEFAQDLTPTEAESFCAHKLNEAAQ